MTDEEIALEKAEHRRLTIVLKKRSPQEWAKLIREVDVPIPAESAEKLITIEHVRVAAANLAWWDFFGNRTCANRWPHRDKYLNKAFVRVPRELTVAALIAIGYPEKWAISRTKEHPVQSSQVKTQKEN